MARARDRRRSGEGVLLPQRAFHAGEEGGHAGQRGAGLAQIVLQEVEDHVLAGGAAGQPLPECLDGAGGGGGDGDGECGALHGMLPWLGGSPSPQRLDAGGDAAEGLALGDELGDLAPGVLQTFGV